MKQKIFISLTIAIAIIVTTATVDFLIWRNQQIKRLESNSSLVQTSNGTIEYTTVGTGPAVLVLHGTPGGYDQTQLLAEMLDSTDHEFIFVSRPGYLRTPLETGVSFEEQADAYASFLDELGIYRTAIIAISGGGPSALQFALRHPDRCSGLVLIAANADVNAGQSNDEKTNRIWLPPAMISKLLFSDFTSWLIVRTAQIMPRVYLKPMLGADYVELVIDNPERVNYFTEFMNSMALFSERRAGAFNDGEQYLNYTGYPLENITIPTLILHGTEDQYVTSAEQIQLDDILPNSEYIEIEGGTHFMLISHHDVLVPIISNFLGALER
jgi:pimeloyl-ACP methyl ester carboxylesterase